MAHVVGHEEKTAEELIFEALVKDYGMQQEEARRLAKALFLTPLFGTLSRDKISDIVWVLANFNNIPLNEKPLNLRGLDVLRAIPILVTPQGFTWAEGKALADAPPSERQVFLQRQFAQQAPTEQEAFMQSEIRRLGLETEESQRQRRLSEIQQQGFSPQAASRLAELERRPFIGEQVTLQQQKAVRQRRASQQEQLEREQFAAMVGEFPAQQPLVSGAIAGIPVPAARRFFGREGGLATAIQGAGIPALRRAWWERRARFPGVSPGGAGDIFMTGTEAEIAEAEEPLIEFERGRAKQLGERDPLEAFLGGFDFLKRFQALTPRERGFQSRQFRPRTRFINF